jgi:hypothetical protein
MRTIPAAAFLAVFAVVSAQAQPGPQPYPGNNVAPVCLRPFDTPGPGAIDHTHVVDPQTILFYMRDGKIWKNTLKARCPSLMFHGFNFATHQDEICSNAQSIRVIETDEVCQLGAFTPYMPTPPANRSYR